MGMGITMSMMPKIMRKIRVFDLVLIYNLISL